MHHVMETGELDGWLGTLLKNWHSSFLHRVVHLRHREKEWSCFGCFISLGSSTAGQAIGGIHTLYCRVQATLDMNMNSFSRKRWPASMNCYLRMRLPSVSHSNINFIEKKFHLLEPRLLPLPSLSCGARSLRRHRTYFKSFVPANVF